MGSQILARNLMEEDGNNLDNSNISSEQSANIIPETSTANTTFEKAQGFELIIVACPISKILVNGHCRQQNNVI